MARNFKRHNEEVNEVWEAFRAGKPIRVPAVFGVSEQNFILTPELNKNNISFRQYMENPDVMMKVQLDFQRWTRWNVTQDREMGPPAESWDPIHIDFQNTAEAAWLGSPINYGSEGSVPDTEPLFREKKEKPYEIEIPDPIHGNIMGRIYEYYEYLKEKIKRWQSSSHAVSRGRRGKNPGTSQKRFNFRRDGGRKFHFNGRRSSSFSHPIINSRLSNSA